MKKVLVTGGTRGLGLAIVSELMTGDYDVIATGRKISPALETLRSRNPKNLKFAPLDLFKDDAHEFVKGITQEHGPLFGFVNNAALGLDGVLATMHENQINQLIEVNVRKPILLTKYVVRSMLLAGEGRIVHISSIIANTGFNGLAVYAATKAALVGFTKSLAREVGKAKITVNAVAPGYMATDMTQNLEGEDLERIRRRSPLGRLATPSEVAKAVSFLLGPGATAITGTTLTVDCGSSV